MRCCSRTSEGSSVGGSSRGKVLLVAVLWPSSGCMCAVRHLECV